MLKRQSELAHLDKLTEKRSKGLESTLKTLEDYGIDYDEVIVRGNAKDELLKLQIVVNMKLLF